MTTIHYKVGGLNAEMPYTEENVAIAAAEADNGEYTIEDDGVAEPDPVEEITTDDVLNALLGVTE